MVAAFGGAPFSVTYNPGVSGSGLEIVVTEYSFAGDLTVDGGSTSTGQSTSPTSGSFTTTGAADLLVGVVASPSSVTSWGAGSGFNLLASSAGSGVPMLAEDQLGVMAGSNAATMTLAPGVFWAASALAFTAGNARLTGTGAGDTFAGSGAFVGSTPLAAAEAHDTLSASGHFIPPASLSSAEGHDTLSGSAHFTAPGVLSKTAGNDTLAGSGHFASPASIAATETHDTLVASGHFTAPGALSKTAGSDTLAATGTFTAPGVLAPTESHDVFAGSAAHATTATLGSTETHDTFASSSMGTLASVVMHEAPDSLSASASTNDPAGLAPTERHDIMSSFATVSPYLRAREGGDVFSAGGTSTGPTAVLTGSGAGDTFSANGGFSFDTRAQLNGLEASDLFAWLATQSAAGGLHAVEARDGFAASSTVASSAGLAAVESGDTFVGGDTTVQYHVYANTGAGDPINYDSPIATTMATTFTTDPLSFPGTWSFGVRAFDVYGEEQNLDCALSIVLDTMGHDITNQPLPPTAMRALARVGGSVQVEWHYPPTTGPRAPTGFHTYIGTGGAPNYATPAATTLFSSGIANAFFTVLTGLIGGGVYTIGVRAFNATAEETNTNTVVVTAIATGPTAVVGLTAAASVTA